MSNCYNSYTKKKRRWWRIFWSRQQVRTSFFLIYILSIFLSSLFLLCKCKKFENAACEAIEWYCIIFASISTIPRNQLYPSLNLYSESLDWICTSHLCIELSPRFYSFFSNSIILSYRNSAQPNLPNSIKSNQIKSNQSDEDGSPGTPIPFTVLSANSTAESVFGSVCGQQLIWFDLI